MRPTDPRRSDRIPAQTPPLERYGQRSEVQLVQDQLAGIDAWHAAQHARQAPSTAVVTREMRLDLSRRMDARRREHAALLARAAEQLDKSDQLLGSRTRTRAVLAHRHPWVRAAIARRLDGLGVDVLGVFEDGADAAGVIVVEQPDLVLVEDRLPTLPGIDVVRRVRRYAPGAVIGAQVMDGSGVSALLEAGAAAVFTRSVAPHDLADQLLQALVRQEGQPVQL